MAKGVAEAAHEGFDPKAVIEGSHRQVERALVRQSQGMGAVGGEMLRFMAERLDAYAQAMEEFQHCRTLADLWAIQVRFGQGMIYAYSGEAAQLAEMAVSTSTDTAQEIRRAA